MTEEREQQLISEAAQHIQQEDWSGAIHVFNELAQLRPTDPRVWYNKGIVNTRLTRFSEARGDFKLALRNKPDYALARQCLTEIELELGPEPEQQQMPQPARDDLFQSDDWFSMPTADEAPTQQPTQEIAANQYETAAAPDILPAENEPPVEQEPSNKKSSFFSFLFGKKKSPMVEESVTSVENVSAGEKEPIPPFTPEMQEKAAPAKKKSRFFSMFSGKKSPPVSEMIAPEPLPEIEQPAPAAPPQPITRAKAPDFKLMTPANIPSPGTPVTPTPGITDTIAPAVPTVDITSLLDLGPVSSTPPPQSEPFKFEEPPEAVKLDADHGKVSDITNADLQTAKLPEQPILPASSSEDSAVTTEKPQKGKPREKKNGGFFSFRKAKTAPIPPTGDDSHMMPSDILQESAEPTTVPGEPAAQEPGKETKQSSEPPKSSPFVLDDEEL